jgi:hypothetical protein
MEAGDGLTVPFATGSQPTLALDHERQGLPASLKGKDRGPYRSSQIPVSSLWKWQGQRIFHGPLRSNVVWMVRAGGHWSLTGFQLPVCHFHAVICKMV